MDEIKAFYFVRAGAGDVVHRPLAAYGLIKDCRSGWFIKERSERRLLWMVQDRYNKQDKPPTLPGTGTHFLPGERPFGLWVSTGGFTNEIVCTDDVLNARISRFGGRPIHKAHVFAAKDDDSKPIPNTFIIGWEYSTNDDNQDIVTVVENVNVAPVSRSQES